MTQGEGSPLGVAIIGGGLFAKEEHLPAVLATPLLKLKAVYSRSQKSAQATASLCPSDAGPVDIYASDAGPGKSYDDLLRRDDITAVIIALTIMDQPTYIEAALAAGKHVLSEKPIAPDLAGAEKLVARYRELRGAATAMAPPTWAVAENFRFLARYRHAADQASALGRVTGLTVQSCAAVKSGNKWYETEWRKNPTHQGGFLLDGGVHTVAAVRLVLSSAGGAEVEKVAAFTTLLQQHLPPADTISASFRLRSGGAGSFVMTFGSEALARRNGIAFGCEGGSVVVSGDEVTVTRGFGDEAKTETKTFEQSSGVKEEVKAWAEALVSGKPNHYLSPEEALGDLEVMEAMLKSGEAGGAPIELKYQ